MNKMSFGQALECLESGKFISRSGWNGMGMYLGLHMPDATSSMTLPFIYMVTPNHEPDVMHRVPWLASQTDMLAKDWGISDV